VRLVTALVLALLRNVDVDYQLSWIGCRVAVAVPDCVPILDKFPDSVVNTSLKK
jgi:hypothetical protein